MELIQIKVGEEFPLYKGSFDEIKGKDVAFFEADDSGNGYIFCIYYNNIKDYEIETIRFNKARLRIVNSIEGYVLPMIKFSDYMIFEWVFDPTLYEDARALQLATENNIVTIYAIDSRTNILKCIRQANLPLKFIQICKESWSRAILEPNFTEKYQNWINYLRRTYTIEGLWNRGIDVGFLGENFNLEEIHYSYKKE
jgi:hypothetical protein